MVPIWLCSGAAVVHTLFLGGFGVAFGHARLLHGLCGFAVMHGSGSRFRSGSAQLVVTLFLSMVPLWLCSGLQQRFALSWWLCAVFGRTRPLHVLCGFAVAQQWFTLHSRWLGAVSSYSLSLHGSWWLRSGFGDAQTT